MEKVKIIVREVLERVVEIELDENITTPEEARELVEQKYANSEIVLDSSDYESTDFLIYNKKERICD